MVDALAGLDRDCDDGARVDRIAALERLQAAAFAAQAAELVRFADSQEAEQRRLGVPARRVGVGVADQLALACRVSPVTGARRLALARTLVGELPSTYAVVARGEISAWVATVVARETDALTPHGRAVVDAQLAGRLAALSPRQVEAATRRAAISLDPASGLSRILCKPRSCEVGVDAVGVSQGELFEGLFPVGDDLALDESARGIAFVRGPAAFLLALPCSFVLECCRSTATAA